MTATPSVPEATSAAPLQAGRPAAEESHRPRLTGSGRCLLALAVLLLALGLWLSYSELLLAGFAMVGCLAASAVHLSRRIPLDVHRDVAPDRVVEGASASEVLTVSTLGRRPSGPMLAIERFAGQNIQMWLPEIVPGRPHRSELALPTARRGCFPVGPLVISRTDPLGLGANVQRHDTNSLLWVHPRVHHIPPIPTGRAETFEGPTSLASPQGGVAFHSLREWQPGDDPRLIHWPSTARTGTLMVRHTVITSEPRLLIVLDTSAASFVDQSFEEAVRVAASFMAAAARGRFPTEFRTTGGISVLVDPAGQGLIEVFDQLALANPTEGDDGLAVLSLMAQRRGEGVSLGVVSGRPASAKLDRLSTVRHRFRRVTLARLDPDPAHRIRIGDGILDVAATSAVDFAQLWTARQAA